MKSLIQLIILSCLLSAIACKVETTRNKKKETPKKEQTSTSLPKSESSQNEESMEQKDGATPEQLAEAKKIIAGVEEGEILAVNAKKLFKIHCSSCHGFKGNLMVNDAKNLTKSTISLDESVAQVYFGKGLMTPYKSVLSKAEIIALAKYAESLRK